MARTDHAARWTIVSLITVWACLTPLARAEVELPDRTLSPYFFVHGDGVTEQLPLKGTEVEVSIAGVIADVKVTQRYRNDGTTPIEAEYVFPGLDAGRGHALTMTIGERRVVAQIREKQQARAEYQAAKQAGKSAALLEQHRPNVFKMNVANILPGDEIAVELRYTELLVPTTSIYEFVFPTVVGPRYYDAEQTAQTLAARSLATRIPTCTKARKPPASSSCAQRSTPAFRIKETASPLASHTGGLQGRAARADRSAARGSQRREPRLHSALPARRRGDRVRPPAVRGRQRELLPRDDRATAPRDASADSAARLRVHRRRVGLDARLSARRHEEADAQPARELRPTDTFNVLLFSGGSPVLSEPRCRRRRRTSSAASRSSIRRRGGGGTELLPALQPRAGPAGRARIVSRSIVVVTDGYVRSRPKRST